jgi:transcriptional regulator with XRE-family HTH domain
MRSKIAQRILNETPEDVKIFVRLYADITIRINQILKEKKISQKDLAESLGKKPSEISKWLNGEHNFTLRSLAKIQAELGEEIVIIPKVQQNQSAVHGKASMVVYRTVPSSNKQGSFDKFNFKSSKQFANVG